MRLTLRLNLNCQNDSSQIDICHSDSHLQWIARSNLNRIQSSTIAAQTRLPTTIRPTSQHPSNGMIYRLACSMPNGRGVWGHRCKNYTNRRTILFWHPTPRTVIVDYGASWAILEGIAILPTSRGYVSPMWHLLLVESQFVLSPTYGIILENIIKIYPIGVYTITDFDHIAT